MANQPKDWVPQLTGKATPEVAFAVQRIYQELASLRDSYNQTISTLQKIKIPTPGAVSTQLQADGSNPLKVTNLSGVLSEPQKAKATKVDALPGHNSILSQAGTLILFNNQIYFYDATNPGTWEPLEGFITEINGETGPAITLAPGTGITVTITSPNTIEIAATGGSGVTSVNTETGPAIVLSPGNGISITTTAPNTITIASSDPAWSSYTPTVTATAGAITTSALEAAYLQTGKTVKYRIFWTGQSSLTTLNIVFTTPVNPRNITNFQMAPVLYQSSSSPFRLVGYCAAFIDDASNTFIVRSTSDFPATTNFNLILEGEYESA